MLCFLLLQGPDRGQGSTDGKYRGSKLFKCEKDCGIFAPFNRVSLSSPSLHEPPPQTEELRLGDRVTYFIGGKCRHGMVLDLPEVDGQQFVQISTVSNIPFFLVCLNVL